jgi:hypothetical protein
VSELSKEEALLFNYVIANQAAFKKLLAPLSSGYWDEPVYQAKAVLVCHLVSKLSIDVDIVLDFMQQLNMEELLYANA